MSANHIPDASREMIERPGDYEDLMNCMHRRAQESSLRGEDSAITPTFRHYWPP